MAAAVAALPSVGAVPDRMQLVEPGRRLRHRLAVAPAGLVQSVAILGRSGAVRAAVRAVMLAATRFGVAVAAAAVGRVPCPAGFLCSAAMAGQVVTQARRRQPDKRRVAVVAVVLTLTVPMARGVKLRFGCNSFLFPGLLKSDKSIRGDRCLMI